ncbi:MAG: potassium channel protein [Myxococcota bacterium]
MKKCEDGYGMQLTRAFRRTHLPIQRAALLLTTVVVIGVVGFKIIGGPEHTLLDAAYMTVVTLTTVGYEEVIPVRGNPAAEAFNIVIMMAGIGSFIFFFSNFTAFIVEGHLARWRGVRKMQKRISQLSGHDIVCGFGETGMHIVRELVQTRRDIVVIDSDPEISLRLMKEFDRDDIAAVVGDATDDDQLLSAGIHRARGIIACAASDKDNLIIAMSARMLNPNLRIVCRCIDDELAPKMRRAGADAVVSPQSIGGMRMVSELIRPTTVSFLDYMLKDSGHAFRVEAVPVEEHSELANQTVGSLIDRKIPELSVVALCTGEDEWCYAPRDEQRIVPGNEVIVISTPEARRKLETIARA